MCITSASDADVGRLLRQSVVLATPLLSPPLPAPSASFISLLNVSASGGCLD